MPQETFIPKPGQIQKKSYVIDAKDKILGRVATKAAILLRGKHKPLYTPHMDTGDFVIIINADKIRVTGKKLFEKKYQTYSGYPSGRKVTPLGTMLQKRPTEAVRLAVNRMIPKGPLGNKIRTRLRVYAGEKHLQEAQKPIALTI